MSRTLPRKRSDATNLIFAIFFVIAVLTVSFVVQMVQYALSL